MLARLYCGFLVPALWITFLCTAGAATTDHLSGDQFLATRNSLNAATVELSVLNSNLPSYRGKVVQLKGTVGGLAQSGDTVSFIFHCEGETFFVKTTVNHPECIRIGVPIRALVTVGPGSIAYLSDLRLEAATYEYEVSEAEKRLAKKAEQKKAAPPAPKTTTKPVLQPVQSARQTRSQGLSSRAGQVYDPYRRAISTYNPRLTAEQADIITKSILAFSEHYGVDPRLVVALIMVESNFRPDATSPKGAMGLGQLMPGTARGLGVSNAYDPVQNIEASIRLIRQHLDTYNDLALALSAYNAGPGAVRKHNGVPPFRETQNYIRKVTEIYKNLCGN